jgi:hypothetical protein
MNENNNCIQYDNDSEPWPCVPIQYPEFNAMDFNIKDFQNLIQENFAQYQSTLEQAESTQSEKLQSQQKFVPRFSDLHNNFGNLLVYHELGSGKTCTSIIVGEAYRAFYHYKKKCKIVVVTPVATQSDYKNEILGWCVNQNINFKGKRRDYDPDHHFGADDHEIRRAKQEQMNKLARQSMKRKEAMKFQKIMEHWDILSHAKFIQDLYDFEKPYLKEFSKGRCLLIIDEAHNLVSEFGKNYVRLKTFLNCISHPLNRIILLSATPIYDKPFEIGLTLNLLNPRQFFPKTQKEFDKKFIENDNSVLFKWMCAGYVSYFSGAHPKYFPRQKIIFLYHEMNQSQLDEYTTTFIEERKNQIQQQRNRQPDDINPSFYIKSRQKANISFPYNKIKDNLEERRNNLSRWDKIQWIKQTYSTKFGAVMELLSQQTGKIVIFSDMLDSGIDALAKLLTFAGFNNFFVWTGQTNKDHITEFKKQFDNPNNDNGERIQMVLGTVTIMEGVSFKNVHHLHILNPWWNLSRINQVIARAVRFKSHTSLPIEEQYVNIYQHFSVLPDGPNPTKIQSVDMKLLHKSREKHQMNHRFQRYLKESAVDCQLNAAINLVRFVQVVDRNDQGLYETYTLNTSNDERINIQPVPGDLNAYILQPPSNDFIVQAEAIECNLEQPQKILITKYTRKMQMLKQCIRRMFRTAVSMYQLEGGQPRSLEVIMQDLLVQYAADFAEKIPSAVIKKAEETKQLNALDLVDDFLKTKTLEYELTSLLLKYANNPDETTGSNQKEKDLIEEFEEYKLNAQMSQQEAAIEEEDEEPIQEEDPKAANPNICPVCRQENLVYHGNQRICLNTECNFQEQFNVGRQQQFQATSARTFHKSFLEALGKILEQEHLEFQIFKADIQSKIRITRLTKELYKDILINSILKKIRDPDVKKRIAIAYMIRFSLPLSKKTLDTVLIRSNEI